MSYPISHIRSQFPILQQQINGNRFIYFDNAATTQKPQCVIDAISEIYCKKNSNIHRGVHHLSNVCTDLYENARKTVASFINAENDEIIFTRGTTEAINLLAFSFGETFCSEGDEIIITAIEHHANIVPWQMLCARKKMTLRVAPVNDSGVLILDELFHLINDRTKLISISHISNVLGTKNPIEKIIEKAHQFNIPVCVDAAQSVPHLSIDVKELDCDFLAFSGHKIYAPNGSGALFGKKNFLENMVPYQSGGSMIEKVTFEKTTFNAVPFKFEAGTPDYISAIALGTAIEYVKDIGIENIKAHEENLTNLLWQKLQEIPTIRFIGNAENSSSTISFLLGNHHPLDVGMMLDKMGIAVRTGHHCAQPLMERFGIKGTIRASLAMYNSEEEIIIFASAIEKISKILG